MFYSSGILKLMLLSFNGQLSTFNHIVLELNPDCLSGHDSKSMVLPVDVYELDPAHVGGCPPDQVGGERGVLGVAAGREDGAARQQPRPQPEGAVVHDGVLGQAHHRQVHTHLGTTVTPSHLSSHLLLEV